MIENLNTQEIHKFNEQASTWWDENGSMRMLHQLNPIRLSFIQKHAKSLSDKKIIDVGCGGGILAESLAQASANVTGIDMASHALQVAQLHALENNLKINYVLSTAENYAIEHPAQFDVVTCMELLEHVPDPKSLIQACATLVKPGGTVFFSTINRTFKAYLLTIIGAEYLMQFLPKGTHDYQQFIKPSELCRWARAAKLSSIASNGLSYHPLTRQFYLSNALDANYLLGFTKNVSA